MQSKLAKHNTELIAAIAKRRAERGKVGITILLTIFIAFILFSSSEVHIYVLSSILILTFIMGVFSYVNFINSKRLRVSYRKFNLIFYSYFGQLTRVFWLLVLVKRAISFFNPLSGYKDPGYSRVKDGASAIGSGFALGATTRSIREAKQVEWLFVGLQSDQGGSSEDV